MNEDFFSKTTNKRPLSGAQKAALLLYLMRTDNTEQVMARLSTDEIRRINDNLSVLSSRIDIYDDIVIVVHGDHYGMQMYDENLIEFLGYDKNNYNDAVMQHIFSNVVCSIKIPGISNIIIDAPTSKNDVKPTLAQICGFEDKK